MATATRITRIIGAAALAAELGIGRQYLNKVINGQRNAPHIRAQLAARNIKCKRYRRAPSH